ncbi:protein charlatan [Trichonephila clavipes]|nr:protein charlatan [Trichonephila clavipes]
MTHSEAFLSAKFGGFHSPFTNDYLLKHGNFFMKPTIHPDGFVYPAINEAARYQIFKDVKCEVSDSDLPLNFAIKQEKPPTPPASTSPTPLKSPSPTDAADSTQWLEHRTPDRKAWIRCPMPPNTLRVHTEYVLVKSVGPLSCVLSHERRDWRISPLQFPCRNCGGGDRGGGVAIYRPFGEFRLAKLYCHLYGAQGQRQAYL